MEDELSVEIVGVERLVHAFLGMDLAAVTAAQVVHALAFQTGYSEYWVRELLRRLADTYQVKKTTPRLAYVQSLQRAIQAEAMRNLTLARN